MKLGRHFVLVGIFGSALSACIGRPAATGGPASSTEGTPDAAAAATLSTCQNGVIEDAEDGDGQLNLVEGRGGYWYTFKDASSEVTPAPGGDWLMSKGGARGSNLSAKFAGKTGTGTNPYVGLGSSLSEGDRPYDGSKYQGISFYARGNGRVHFSIIDINTSDKGGICGKDGREECYNAHGAHIELTPEWKEYRYRWSDLRQEPGWGHRAAFDTTKMFNIQWQIKGAGEMQVDELMFIGCPAGSPPLAAPGAAPAAAKPAAAPAAAAPAAAATEAAPAAASSAAP